jgi:Domain of unknown function (DUF4082)
MFNPPVPIQAGHTYVASYHVPDAQYAFQYDFLRTQRVRGRPDHGAELAGQ